MTSNQEARVARVQERRRSGAAGRHLDRRERRTRTRAAAKARALRDA